MKIWPVAIMMSGLSIAAFGQPVISNHPLQMPSYKALPAQSMDMLVEHPKIYLDQVAALNPGLAKRITIKDVATIEVAAGSKKGLLSGARLSQAAQEQAAQDGANVVVIKSLQRIPSTRKITSITYVASRIELDGKLLYPFLLRKLATLKVSDSSFVDYAQKTSARRYGPADSGKS